MCRAVPNSAHSLCVSHAVHSLVVGCKRLQSFLLATCSPADAFIWQLKVFPANLCHYKKHKQTQVLFIICWLCRMLQPPLPLNFVYLTVKLFILSFCLASPTVRTRVKKFHSTAHCTFQVPCNMEGRRGRSISNRSQWKNSASNFHTCYTRNS